MKIKHMEIIILVLTKINYANILFLLLTGFSFDYFYFFNFLLIRCQFHIMCLSLHSCPCPSISTLYLCKSPTKTNKHRKSKSKNKYLKVETVACHGVLHNISFWPKSFNCECYCHKSLVWFEASGLCYTINTGTPLRNPVVALCHWNPAALDQQNWTFHVIQQFMGRVDVGVG